jgi:hypothetical protein
MPLSWPGDPWAVLVLLTVFTVLQCYSVSPAYSVYSVTVLQCYSFSPAYSVYSVYC